MSLTAITLAVLPYQDHSFSPVAALTQHLPSCLLWTPAPVHSSNVTNVKILNIWSHTRTRSMSLQSNVPTVTRYLQHWMKWRYTERRSRKFKDLDLKLRRVRVVAGPRAQGLVNTSLLLFNISLGWVSCVLWLLCLNSAVAMYCNVLQMPHTNSIYAPFTLECNTPRLASCDIDILLPNTLI